MPSKRQHRKSWSSKHQYGRIFGISCVCTNFQDPLSQLKSIKHLQAIFLGGLPWILVYHVLTYWYLGILWGLLTSTLMLPAQVIPDAVDHFLGRHLAAVPGRVGCCHCMMHGSMGHPQDDKQHGLSATQDETSTNGYVHLLVGGWPLFLNDWLILSERMDVTWPSTSPPSWERKVVITTVIHPPKH